MTYFPIANTEITPYTSAGRPTMRHVSATTVIEEVLEQGRWIGAYRSAAGQVQRENVVAGMPNLDSLALPLHAFELEIDGQSLHNRWEWGGAAQRAGAREGVIESVVELRHAVRPVTVRVVTRLDGTPALARWLEIVNTGTAPAALGHIAPWSGVLWSTPARPLGSSTRLTTNPSATEPAFRVGAFAGEAWGEEGDFAWRAVGPDTLRIARTATGRGYASPYFIVENRVTGQRAFLALAWSNNYAAEFCLHAGTHLHARLHPLAPAPLRVIAPGETVTGPEVHLGLYHGTLDAAVQAWHAHIRASVAPPRPDGMAIYTIAGRVVEEPGDWILREADIAAEMGTEAFMVDAGWYGDTFGHWAHLRGDWTEGDWLPGGIAGVREHCHAQGLKFGLWHEAEAITKASRLYADHPDWLLRTDNGRECGQTLDLANPEAARFFEDTVLRIIREHRLDFYKLDYNVDVREGGQTVRDGFAESESWRHHDVLYRTYDRVRREYPHVCLEGCASGGARNDIGMLARFHYLCESDWSLHPIAIRAINALTLFIPPESLCYYHNHANWCDGTPGAGAQQAHLTADAETHLRVTLFALPIFVGFGAQNADRTTEFYQRTRRYLALHRGFCRPVLARHPAVYHHTPDIGVTGPTPWCVLEYAARDASRGYAGVFKLAHGGDGYRLHLRGIDRGAEYTVTFDNSGHAMRCTGRELLHGLPIELDAALTSELVLYERV